VESNRKTSKWSRMEPPPSSSEDGDAWDSDSSSSADDDDNDEEESSEEEEDHGDEEDDGDNDDNEEESENSSEDEDEDAEGSSSSDGDDEDDSEVDDEESSPAEDPPEEFHDEEVARDEPKKEKKGWFWQKKDKAEEVAPLASVAAVDTDVENPPEQFHDEDIEEKEPMTEPGTLSRTVASTRERKIITSLAICVCILLIILAMGIGAAIGVVVGRNTVDSGDSNNQPIDPPTPVEPTPPSESPPSTPPSESNPPQVVATPQPTPGQTTPAPTSQPSSMPSSLPTETPEMLFAFLVANSFDGGASLRDEESPQFRAYEWLLSHTDIDSMPDYKKLQRYALATFFYSTGGEDSWSGPAKVNWVNTEVDECEWAVTSGRQCDDGFNITNLAIDNAGAQGTLPAELGHLTMLDRFSVRSDGPGTPQLSGPFPSSIGNLVEMQTVRLNGNGITGQLPSELGRLTNCR
jgi:hypothetical protein